MPPDQWLFRGNAAHEHPTTLDLAIIGGGVADSSTRQTIRAGPIKVVLLSAPAVGGLWPKLPSWQTSRSAQWTGRWATCRSSSPLQLQVLANIESWVSRFRPGAGHPHRLRR